jgi:RHS repeat-associated protein
MLKLVLRTLLILICMVLLGTASRVARGQGYLTSTGQPSFAAPEPVELGFTDTSNGNLHLDIPMVVLPQRGSGQGLTMHFIYDSSIWNVWGPPGNASWMAATPGVSASALVGGWRLPIIGLGMAGRAQGPINTSGCREDFEWVDIQGTARFFPLTVGEPGSGCATTATAYATDSSGYEISVTYPTAGSEPVIAVYAPDGTLVDQSLPPTDSQGRYILAKDSNGNYFSSDNLFMNLLSGASSGHYYDSLGRIALNNALSGCTSNPAQACYYVPNSQGATSEYIVTGALIPVSTNFGEAGVTECNTSCTISVIQSIGLPDGTSYSFKYDCSTGSGNPACGSPSGQSGYYGLLTSVTLPTGGQITYGYETFKDAYASYTRWLNSRVSEGGTWSYTPAVVTTCTVGQTGCKQTTTVTKPSGASVVTTFTLNNGAWPTQIQTYSSGTLVSTVTNTFDFSNSCPLLGCTGAAYVRLTGVLTSITSSAGSITKQTKYTYDTPQKGNVAALQEWKFLPGTSPSFPAIPDRATNTTYLSTGTNDIDRPLTVSVCNNSGTDTYCAGGGSRVSQTVNTYDSYSGGLTVKSGIANHDDGNFGGTYTTRGNPTQVANWVSGSQYLTTQLTYDTTGQVTQVLDPKLNSTTYSYTDRFYSDNNNNPPASYPPAAPTNAYATGVTTGLGTQNFGYYFGSGKQAFYTDLNNATTYSHYVDSFDRPTETVFPIGWSLASYPSSNETDTFDGVADSSPSQSCSSCQHIQIILDGLGRETSRKLVNNPLGIVSADTSYDTSGRVQTVSHPYTSGPVYETYAYDVLDRTTQNSHPDSQSLQTSYGPSVTTAGALSSQQGAPSTYGYGYPALRLDEAGKPKEEWIDGFGNVIEVDVSATQSSGTQATGSVTISGGDGSETSNPCKPKGNCPITVYDSGTISVTVASYIASTSYGEESTDSSLAAALESQLNSSSSPVTATVSGGVISITSKATGSGADYSLSATRVSNLGLGSFPVSTSGATLTGGTGTGVFGAAFGTFYTYSVTGNLTQVVQGVQTRTFAYDGLGRVIQETTPEAGTITISYTTGGTPCSGDPSDICSRTDARGLTTTYSYDSQNRVISKANSAGTASYYYDQGGAAAFAVGRLTEMTDPSGSETYTYDKNGRVTSLQKIIGTATYTTSYQYLGGTEGLTQITYPSGRIVHQSFNAIGQLCGVAAQSSPTSCSGFTTPFASGYGYDATGHVTAFTYGNGVVSSFSFSPQREQLSTISYIKGTTTLFGLNYWFQQNSSNCPNGLSGNNDQIQCITDNVQSGRSVAYTYDPMSRLLAAKTSGSTTFPQWGLAETYDEYGNRWAQSVTAGSAPSVSLSFGPSGMNSSTTNRPNGYTYDASGDLASEPVSPANNYTYDANNRLTSFSGGAGSASYTYDDNGLRVEKVANGTATVSIYSGSQLIAEYDNGAAPTSPSREYIYADSGAGAQILAMVSAGTTTYYHQDHLSIRVITDANGNDIAEQGHLPFGESWYNASNGKFIFTTYERDSESGLDYALARYYNSRIAAFCSADPLEGNADDPQSWNRYAYARNDPINLIDPSGKSVLSDILEALSIILAAIFPPSAAVDIPALDASSFALAQIAQFNYFANSSLQEGQGQQGTAVPPPGATAQGTPPNYHPCAPKWFTITGVGPIAEGQATGKGSTGTPPTNGDVAFNPKNYGLSDSQGRKIADSDSPLVFKPDWSQAQITGPHGKGTVAPAPNKGMPQIPQGLPVGTDDTLPGTDTIGGVNRAANQNRLDLYRYGTHADANAATRRVPVVVYIPNGSKAQCPK